MREAGREVARQTDMIQRVQHLPLNPVKAMQAERGGDDLADAVARIEAAHRVLKDHLKAAAQGAQARLIQMGDVLAVKAHMPARRLQKPNHGAAKR